MKTFAITLASAALLVLVSAQDDVVELNNEELDEDVDPAEFTAADEVQEEMYKQGFEANDKCIVYMMATTQWLKNIKRDIFTNTFTFLKTKYVRCFLF